MSRDAASASASASMGAGTDSAKPDMHIRLKRGRTTVFLRCSLSDKLTTLKANLAEAVAQKPQNIRLHRNLQPDSILDENLTVTSAELTNDDIVYFVYRIPTDEEANPDAGETAADEQPEETWENPEAEDIKMPGQDVIATEEISPKT